jgi:hypothetical protein
MVNKRFWLGILVMALVFGMTVVGCDNGSTGGNGNGNGIVSKETISGKWEIGDSENSTFEFTPDNIYIVVGNFGQPVSRAVTQQTYVYTGKYTISGTKITLEGFGIIEVKSFSDEDFSFSLKLANSNESYNFQAIKQENTIESSTRTNLLCRYWKVVKVSNSDYEEMIGYSVLFSKAGTYLVTHNDGSSGLAEWKWKNTEQTILQYSWNHWVYSSGEVQIQDLTASSLKINENGLIYELVLGN